MAKKISIIIPCYNVEKFIDRCVESLIKQTIGLNNLELIFVNDASTDRTLEKLKSFEAIYPEDILIIDLEENIKQGGARNVGLQYASTDYIGFVDADDWVEELMYEKLYEKAAEHDCDMVCCKFKRVVDEDTPMGRTGKADQFRNIVTDDDRKIFILEGIEGGICCNIYRKKIIIENEIYFPEKITYEDNFWLPVLQLYINKFFIIEEYFYHYYVNMNSTITTKNSLHHFDRLLIELLKIEEYKGRGFWDAYKNEFELQFIKLYFINTIHIMFTRFTVVPVTIFEEMQRTLLSLFPDYKNNRYLELKLNEVEKHVILIIEMKITYEELNEMANQYMQGYLYIPNRN